MLLLIDNLLGGGRSKTRCQMTYNKKANDFEPHKEGLSRKLFTMVEMLSEFLDL